VQWQAALKSPPSLTAIFPNLASTSLYHDSITLNGVFRLSLAFGWGPVRQESRVMQNTGMHTMEGGPEAISFEKMQWHLPLSDMQRLAGRRAAFWDDWLRHPDYDDYWQAVSVEEVIDRIRIPVHTFGGWFDILVQGALRGYQGVRGPRRMVVGAWGHGPTRKYGDLDFGEHAYVDPQSVELRWYDRWLKGLDNGLDQEPPVKLFTMGVNRWRGENEYPLARTQYRKLYFHSDGRPNSYRGDGRLSWEPPSGDPPPARYRHDPEHPVPSIGGSNCCGAPTPAGPVDQRPVETRNDVLVYTSDYLETPLDVTGPVKVVLYAASDAPDVHFIAKLMDVYPDGKAYNMAEGGLRARHREGFHRAVMLEPGKVVPLTIDLVGTSVVFQPGHRIRVSVASSHFPQFDRMPADRASQQSVYATRAHPSHIVLPVIP
jgi:putative CocE/NonD family hydrolase